MKTRADNLRPAQVQIPSPPSSSRRVAPDSRATEPGPRALFSRDTAERGGKAQVPPRGAACSRGVGRSSLDPVGVVAKTDSAGPAGFSAVPVVDLSLASAEPERVAGALRTACEDVGFFYVSGHGIPSELVERVQQQAAALFALDPALKHAMARRPFNPESPNRYRGYFPTQDGGTSYKEGIDFGPEGVQAAEEGALHEANLWPSDAALPQFRATMKAYYSAMLELGDKILDLIARALKIPNTDLRALMSPREVTTLRLLHYPELPGAMKAQLEAGDERALGCSEHTDSGIITLLHQDKTGGLQVKNGDGRWIDVPPREGSFVVNLGDVLQRWTNDRFIATTHRVLPQLAGARYSIPLFYEPSSSAIIRCLPAGVTPARPARYPAMRYDVFLADKIKQFSEFNAS